MNDLQKKQVANPTEEELQRFLLFAIAVAGKTAKQVDRAIDVFLNQSPGVSPFTAVQDMTASGTLAANLARARLGQYTKLVRAFTTAAASGLDLRTCTVNDLERIHGVGPKTSRFFLMYSRPDQRYAALDTHILKWLRSRGHDVPKSTPSSKKKYKEIEQLFLFIADDLGVDPSVLDSFIWQKYSRGTKDGAV